MDCFVAVEEIISKYSAIDSDFILVWTTRVLLITKNGMKDRLGELYNKRSHFLGVIPR